MYVEVKQRAANAWSKRPALLRGRNLWLGGGAALVVLVLLWTLLRGDSSAEPYRTAPDEDTLVAANQ